jgi:MFS family permease
LGVPVLSLDWIARDGKIILFEKAVRTIPYGFMGVVFPIYLTQLGFNPLLVGLVLTLTTVTSAFYTFVASLVADRIGRRRTLVFFALTDSVAGALLFLVVMPWGPVAAGVVGNLSVGAGEVGPYLSLEQAILPKVTHSNRRTLGFSVYNLIGYGASASGALVAGLPQFNGFGRSTFQPLFLAYLVSGILGMALYSVMSKNVEQETTGGTGYRALSKTSRPVVLKLSALFGLDAFGGGFIGSSIIAYYFFLRYQLQLSSLGLIVAGTQVVTAASFLLASRIAGRIGLINTMVFTHIPSNVVLTAIPFAPSVSTAVLLLFCRQSMSQLDIAPRQSYVVSIVPESDRTAASGITNSSRSFSQSPSPFLAGYAIENLWIGSPFVFAGSFKIAYDLLLYRFFHKNQLDARNPSH